MGHSCCIMIWQNVQTKRTVKLNTSSSANTVDVFLSGRWLEFDISSTKGYVCSFGLFRQFTYWLIDLLIYWLRAFRKTQRRKKEQEMCKAEYMSPAPDQAIFKQWQKCVISFKGFNEGARAK